MKYDGMIVKHEPWLGKGRKYIDHMLGLCRARRDWQKLPAKADGE